VKYDVVEARYMGGYVIWLRFRDNTSGEIDLEKGLYGPMFEPLRDLTVFKRFKIHPEFHTLTWLNGADLAPEFLHDNVRERRETSGSRLQCVSTTQVQSGELRWTAVYGCVDVSGGIQTC